MMSEKEMDKMMKDRMKKQAAISMAMKIAKNRKKK